MGIYDRDYYRTTGPSFLGSFSDRGIVCKWLIGIYLVVILLQLITKQADGSDAVTDAAKLDLPQLFQGQVWRLVTFSFLHTTHTPWPIVFNMIFLWWFGHAIEDIYGSREFLWFYLSTILISALSFVVAVLFRDRFEPGLRHTSVLLGPNSSITALLLLFACHYPTQTILVMYIVPVPIWLFAGFSVLRDVFGFFGEVQMSTAACHFGAGAFALLYYRLQLRVSVLIPDWRKWSKRWSQPRLRLHREQDPLTPAAVAAPHYGDEDQLEAKMDAILEKISRTGKESLTEGERALLLRASEVYRRRRS